MSLKTCNNCNIPEEIHSNTSCGIQNTAYESISTSIRLSEPGMYIVKSSEGNYLHYYYTGNAISFMVLRENYTEYFKVKNAITI